jgi:hypothetical protein
MDDELRRALKPVDPGPAFTARVLAAIEVERSGGRNETATGRQPRVGSQTVMAGRERRAPVWVWPALAASLVAGVVGARWAEERRETARALQARAQLIQALRLTSAKLNVAREVLVQGGTHRLPESREPGAESRDPLPESREPGAKSRNPLPESREPGAKSRDPGAERREPKAGIR